MLRDPSLPAATALAVEDGRIVWVGDEAGAETWVGAGSAAPEVMALDGALVGSAFVDSHVHTVRTGFALTGLDLSGLTGPDGLTRTLDAVASFARARPDASVIVGQGWDETAWSPSRLPTAAELERAAPGRRTYLTRVDSHSSVISPALAAAVPGLADQDGWSTDGRVERSAHHAVRLVLESLISDADRLDAARAACRAMAARGIVGFHENAAPHIGPEAEIGLVRQAAQEVGLRAVVYWGELAAEGSGTLDTARRLGVAGLAGDLIADGAFGSRTAALHAPYADAGGTCGHAYVSAAQVHEHVVLCTRAGLQAGFHCIGDAALDAIGEGFARAAEQLGAPALRAAHHRLEHVEMPSPSTIAVLADLGVHASVQPMFDGLWGGPRGMYAARLGERWLETNLFGDLARAGVDLAFGSDTPVTSLGPWAAIRAAVHHHRADQRLGPWSAVRAHTDGAARAGGDLDLGLRPGARADLAVWDVPGGVDEHGIPRLDLGGDLPHLVRTVAAGRTIHETEA